MELSCAALDADRNPAGVLSYPTAAAASCRGGHRATDPPKVGDDTTKP